MALKNSKINQKLLKVKRKCFNINCFQTFLPVNNLLLFVFKNKASKIIVIFCTPKDTFSHS